MHFFWEGRGFYLLQNGGCSDPRAQEILCINTFYRSQSQAFESSRALCRGFVGFSEIQASGRLFRILVRVICLALLASLLFSQ